MNPWLALPDGGPSPVLTRRLRAAHEALVTRVDAPSGPPVRPVVWDSWRRSLSSGVDPDGAPPRARRRLTGVAGHLLARSESNGHDGATMTLSPGDPAP